MCVNLYGGQYLKVWYPIWLKIGELFLYDVFGTIFHLLFVEILHLSADTVDGT